VWPVERGGATFNKAEVKLELDDEDSSAVKEGEITGPDFGPSSDPKYGGFGGGGGFGSGGGGSDPEPEPEDSSWAKTEPVETRLLKAVRAGDVIQIEEIIKSGVISLTDPKVKSCLYEHLLYAGEAKNPVVVDLLIRHGADVDFDEDGETALHMTAQDGELDSTRLLLKAGAQVDLIHHPGGTPLHLASEEGNAEIAFALTEAGADPEILDDSGRTPLHRAAGSETPDVAVGRVLIKALQNKLGPGQTDMLMQYVNSIDQEAKSALHLAVLCCTSEEHFHFIKYLLEECRANPNTMEKETLQTPLHDAIDRGDGPTIRLLLQHNADVNMQNQHGETCDLMASQKGLDLTQLKADGLSTGVPGPGMMA